MNLYSVTPVLSSVQNHAQPFPWLLSALCQLERSHQLTPRCFRLHDEVSSGMPHSSVIVLLTVQTIARNRKRGCIGDIGYALYPLKVESQFASMSCNLQLAMEDQCDSCYLVEVALREYIDIQLNFMTESNLVVGLDFL